ncbi:MAG: hypothetical protein IPN44_12730 [Flavobacteriales bacterium]|nr:hypothetical protein [Flavobacteriales bacterium]
MQHPTTLCAALLSTAVLCQTTAPTALSAWAYERSGAFQDTAHIDQLLDSAKAWVSTGDDALPLLAVEEALHEMDALRDASNPTGLLDQREWLAYKIQGMAHHYAGRYAPALTSFQAVQKAAERLGRPTDIAGAMIYQSYEYRAMGETDRAKNINLAALRILEEFPEDGNLGNLHSTLGSIYNDAQQYDSSFYHHRIALGIYHRVKRSNLEALCQVDIADLFMLTNDFDSAYHYLSLAKATISEGSNDSDKCIFLGQYARALFGLGRYAEANKALTEAEAIALALENDEYQNKTYEMLALVASAEHRGFDALRYIGLAREALLRDQSLEKAQELTEARLKVEHESELAIDRLNLAAEQRSKRNVMVGAALVACIAGLLLWLLRASRRNARLLLVKNEKITRTQGQLVMATKQREAEQVRTRISRDIHDELGGDLTKVALLSTEIARRMERDPQNVPALLQSLGRVSREANAALRDIVWSVDPEQDTWQGLVNHAEVYSNRILEGSNLRSELHFEFNGPDATLDPASKQHIFLVLKEALNNAVKHAQATLVHVRLSTSPSGYELAVLDNGTGFDQHAMGSGSNGLRNMRSRAAALQAALSLQSSSIGTQLELKGAIPA